MSGLVVFLAAVAVVVVIATVWLIRQLRRAPLIGPDHMDYWTGREVRAGERDAYRREHPHHTD